MQAIGLIAATAIFAIGAVQAQTIYKSIGPDGNTVYSDHPPTDGKVEKTFHFVELPSSPVPDLPIPAKGDAGATAAAPAAAVPVGGVVMYSATWCGYCRRAKAYLAKKGVAYTNIDIDSPGGRAAFAQSGKGGVPLLLAGGRHIRGFSADAYDAFFGGR